MHTRTVTGDDAGRPGSWAFLTSHALVLLAVTADPDRRLEEIADEAGITRRRALSVLRDLERGGYIERTKVGRRNHYLVVADQPMRRPAMRHQQVQDLLSVLGQPAPAPPGDLTS